MNNLFYCTTCKNFLEERGDNFMCRTCSFCIKKENGVWVDSRVLVEQDKSFYDAIYESAHGEQWYQGLNRASFAKKILEYISLSYRRERFFKRHLKGRNNVILDLACGAGRDYFNENGKVVGVDLSYPPLLQAKDRYDIALQSGVGRLPFADNTFDYVVSSDFFGHVRNEDKDALLREIYRVLKPTGKTIHVVETDSTNYLFAIAHRDPELFKKYFIEQIGGHIGLEMPTECVARWKKNEFKITKIKKIWGTIWPIPYYSDIFGKEYQKKNLFIRWLCRLSRVLGSIKIVQVVCNILLNPINSLVEATTSLNHGVGIMIVCQKKK